MSYMQQKWASQRFALSSLLLLPTDSSLSLSLFLPLSLLSVSFFRACVGKKEGREREKEGRERKRGSGGRVNRGSCSCLTHSLPTCPLTFPALDSCSQLFHFFFPAFPILAPREAGGSSQLTRMLPDKPKRKTCLLSSSFPAHKRSQRRERFVYF